MSIETERGKKVGQPKAKRASKAGSYVVERTPGNRTIVRDAATGRFVSHSKVSSRIVQGSKVKVTRKSTQDAPDRAPKPTKGKKKK